MALSEDNIKDLLNVALAKAAETNKEVVKAAVGEALKIHEARTDEKLDALYKKLMDEVSGKMDLLVGRMAAVEQRSSAGSAASTGWAPSKRRFVAGSDVISTADTDTLPTQQGLARRTDRLHLGGFVRDLARTLVVQQLDQQLKDRGIAYVDLLCKHGTRGATLVFATAHEARMAQLKLAKDPLDFVHPKSPWGEEISVKLRARYDRTFEERALGKQMSPLYGAVQKAVEGKGYDLATDCTAGLLRLVHVASRATAIVAHIDKQTGIFHLDEGIPADITRASLAEAVEKANQAKGLS